MTRQTWTAAVSALLFVISAGFIALTPVPFVTYAPGLTYNMLAGDAITVEGLPTHPTTGELRLTTLQVTEATAPVSLPEVLYAYWSPDREVYPREAVYPKGVTSAAPQPQTIGPARSDVVAAALRAAGVEVRQMPMVETVAGSGPAAGRLRSGDFVLAIDGVATPTIAAVNSQIEGKRIGSASTFSVLRDGERLEVPVDIAGSKSQAGVPVWGGNLVMGHSYAPRVTFGLDQVTDLRSSGLMLGLAIFDRITPGSLTGEHIVAGAGRMDGSGAVDSVPGIRERLLAAERSGADVFLVPAGNCVDLEGLETDMRIVSVASLDDAISALDALADPSTEGMVKGCT